MAYLETREDYALATEVIEPVEAHWTPYESEAVLKQRTDMARRNWIATGRV